MLGNCLTAQTEERATLDNHIAILSDYMEQEAARRSSAYDSAAAAEKQDSVAAIMTANTTPTSVSTLCDDLITGSTCALFTIFCIHMLCCVPDSTAQARSLRPIPVAACN